MEKLWDLLILKLQGSPQEFPTTPMTNKAPVWFRVHTDGGVIYVSNARDHKPSSKIKGQRNLTYDEFERMYPIYLRRLAGKSVSAEAQQASYNQVYWYSLIKHCIPQT